MANINIKTNFVDGEKLFAQQLNNNFKTIQEGMNADNKIIWQDGEEVLFKRYITNDIENLPIVDGAIIYDIEKGRHYIDYNGKRIQVGSSGKEVLVQDIQPIEEDNKIWIESDFVNSMGTEVVNSLDGDETNMSPSVRAVKKVLLDTYSTEEVKTNKIWKDGKPIYRRVISTIVSRILDELNSLNVDSVVDLKGNYDSDYDFNWEINSNVPEANYRFSIYRVKSTKAFNGSHGDFISGTNSIEVTIEYTKTTDSEVISNEI